MNSIQVLISCLALIILGLSISANNFIHSIVINYLLYNDRITSQLTRLMGFILVLSSLLIVIGSYDIFLMIIVLVILVFIFLAIRGRGKIDKHNKKKKQDLINMHFAEIEAKKLKIEQLRHKLELKNAENLTTPMSISKKNKSKWNDGKPTNKDIIEQLNS